MKRNPLHSIQSRLYLIILNGFVTFKFFNTVKRRIKAQNPPLQKETAFTRSRQKSLLQADSKGLHSALGTATHCPLECAWAEGLAFLWVSALVSFIFLLWCEGMDSVKGKFSNLLLGNVTSKGCSVHHLGRPLPAPCILGKVLTHYTFPLPVLKTLLAKQGHGHFK